LIFGVVAVEVLVSLGCQGLVNQEAAVQKAIQEHLAERSDLALDKMTMVMERVTVDGNTAQAEVVFGVADDPQSRMSYQYDLRREDGRWLVEAGRPSASQLPHPEMGEAMPGDSSPAEPSSLPEGHPPISEMNPHGEGPLPSGGP
jgi:hypothetical protein